MDCKRRREMKKNLIDNSIPVSSYLWLHSIIERPERSTWILAKWKTERLVNTYKFGLHQLTGVLVRRSLITDHYQSSLISPTHHTMWSFVQCRFTNTSSWLDIKGLNFVNMSKICKTWASDTIEVCHQYRSVTFQKVITGRRDMRPEKSHKTLVNTCMWLSLTVRHICQLSSTRRTKRYGGSSSSSYRVWLWQTSSS